MTISNLQHVMSSSEWNAEDLKVFEQWQNFRRSRAARWQGVVHQLQNQLQTTQLQAKKQAQVAELSNQIGALTHGIDNLALHLMENPALGAELAGLFKNLQTAQQELQEARKVPIYTTLTLHEDITVQDLQDLLFLLTGISNTPEIPQTVTEVSPSLAEPPQEETPPPSAEEPEATEPQTEPVRDVLSQDGSHASVPEIQAKTPVEHLAEPVVPASSKPEVPLGQVSIPTPSLQKAVESLLQALLPQPRAELLSLMPRRATDWEQVDTHFKLRTLLSKLRLEQPSEQATLHITQWYETFRDREVQVLEMIDPDLEGEKELAWMVFAAFLRSLHRWELPVGQGKHRVYFKNPRTLERIEQFLRHASAPVTLHDLNRVLMLPADQLEAALSILPFAKQLPDGHFVHREAAHLAGSSRPQDVPSPAARDLLWQEILEVLDPQWHALADALQKAGLPAPDDCHVDLHDGVQVTGSQALLWWNARKVAVVESAEVTSAGHQTLSVQVPDLVGQLEKALHG